MEKKYKRNTVLFLIVGFALLFMVISLMVNRVTPAESTGILLLLCMVFMCLGCMYWAKGKGYHGAWGLLGLLFYLGVIIIAFFPEKRKDYQPTRKKYKVKAGTTNTTKYLTLLGKIYSKHGSFLGSGEKKSREIGMKINASLGFDGMVYICESIRSELGQVAYRQLEAAWDGIGMWR